MYFQTRFRWRKNTRPLDDGFNVGVDISRNFEGDWKSCPAQSEFSPTYSGPSAATENETMFVQGVLNKYRKDIKVYVSLRKDGHSISYPLGYDSTSSSKATLERVAGLVAAKVNQRAGGVHLFVNESIFELNGVPWCGHSVDYAHQYMNVIHAYELRVFLESENRMMTKFQTLPRGYETSLRNGYYSAIRELYSIMTKDSQFRHY
jgi:hypothetical protein